MAEETENRAVEFAELKHERMEVKRARLAAKQERGAAARAVAEVKKAQRVATLEDGFRLKEESLREVMGDREREHNLKRERMTQARLERTLEKERAASATEFHYVGYVEANQKKTAWLEREAQKRRTLSSHVRQEREALDRARAQVLSEIDVEERVKRRQLVLEYR
jgi:hypothetical protein